MAGAGPEPTWTVVIPVKRLDRAKSRLSTRPAGQRADIALAFASDVVAAACACAAVSDVVVVTDDDRAGRALHGVGPVRVVPDRPDAGLNPALQFGATQADPGSGVAALSSDLPALRAAELQEALGLAAGHRRAFVADASGVGTTLLVAAPGVALEPCFGPRSRARHAASGAVELHPVDAAGLRRDVDTEADLWDALRLGVGPATRGVLGL